MFPRLRYVTLRYVTLRYVTLRYVTLRYVTLRYIMFVIFSSLTQEQNKLDRLSSAVMFPTSFRIVPLFVQVNEVINHFGIVRYIGIGVGLGGNVLIRHSLQYPGVQRQ